MPFLFTCPHCESPTLVEDRLSGATGPCAQCGKPITVLPPDRNIPPRRRRPAAPTPQSIQLMLVLFFSSCLLLVLMGWVATTVILPSWTRPASNPSLQVAANLTRIGAALRAYHQVHGRYPPPYLADEQGKPEHSWRVLILPYLDERLLHAAYRFDEPWDGPNNSQLQARMPSVFGSPDDPDGNELGITAFLAVTGPGTVFPPGDGIRLADVRDNLDETLSVVESAEAEILWLEPRDLSITRMSFRVNGPAPDSIRRRQSDSPPHVLLLDGTVRRLRLDTPPSLLQGMTTIRGFEAIDWSVVEAR
jgi:hypothetical protein